jgi:hypothetical protein
VQVQLDRGYDTGPTPVETARVRPKELAMAKVALDDVLHCPRGEAGDAGQP